MKPIEKTTVCLSVNGKRTRTYYGKPPATTVQAWMMDMIRLDHVARPVYSPALPEYMRRAWEYVVAQSGIPVPPASAWVWRRPAHVTVDIGIDSPLPRLPRTPDYLSMAIQTFSSMTAGRAPIVPRDFQILDEMDNCPAGTPARLAADIAPPPTAPVREGVRLSIDVSGHRARFGIPYCFFQARHNRHLQYGDDE